MLNRHYAPVHIIPVRRCMVLLYRELVEVVSIEEGQYATHDFGSWVLFSEMLAEQICGMHGSQGLWNHHHLEWIRTSKSPILVPRVIRLLRYDKVPLKTLRFNRRTLFARDEHCCQYCGRNYPLNQLSLDHVVPRSRGGETSWENVVCCCLKCNNRKGDRSLSQSGMKLLRHPFRPKQSPLMLGKLGNPRYEQWRMFLESN